MNIINLIPIFILVSITIGFFVWFISTRKLIKEVKQQKTLNEFKEFKK